MVPSLIDHLLHVRHVLQASAVMGFNFMVYRNVPRFPGKETDMGPDLFDSYAQVGPSAASGDPVSPLTMFLAKEEGVGCRAVTGLHGLRGGPDASLLPRTRQATVIGGLFSLSLYFIIWKRTSNHKSGKVTSFGFRIGWVPASALSLTCCITLGKRQSFSEPQFSHLYIGLI